MYVILKTNSYSISIAPKIYFKIIIKVFKNITQYVCDKLFAEGGTLNNEKFTNCPLNIGLHCG